MNEFLSSFFAHPSLPQIGVMGSLSVVFALLSLIRKLVRIMLVAAGICAGIAIIWLIAHNWDAVQAVLNQWQGH